MIPTLFLVTVFIFSLIRLIPGDVIDLMLTEMGDQAQLAAEGDMDAYIKHSLGLDVPVYTQYGRWLGLWPNAEGSFSGVFQGNLGKSLWRGQPVTGDILHRMPVSFELGIVAILVALSVSLPIGTYSAIRQDTAGDYLGRTVGILAISLPSFWVATIVVVYSAIYLNWSPPLGYIPFFEDPMGNLVQFIVPGIILGMVMSGTAMRMTRTMLLEVLRQDYIRTAWSKGLRERTVVLRHAMRNALIPVVTIVGMQIPIVIGGSIVIETIFALPGVGLLLIDALNKRDYPVISGVNLLLGSGVLIINLIIDLTYAWLDPRVSYR